MSVVREKPCRIVESPPVYESEEAFNRAFFERKAQTGEPMKPLGKPCHDCAVEWGLYSCFTDELAKQPREIQEAASARWFCHNHPNRACRGNINRLASLPTDAGATP